MKIHFGLSLDGQRARQQGNRLGDLVAGPMGMLDVLEGMLGLQAESVSNARRIAQYRDCLERANVVPRFYSRSFAVDALGVAATLLGWRDLWHLHGWNKRFDTSTSRRLRDLDDVETLAAAAVAPSMGERLKVVAGAMTGRRLPIERITLADPLEAFPLRWQAALARLPVESAPEIEPIPDRLLGQLQRSLIDAHDGKQPEVLPWREDGSLRIVRAETRLAAARWLASELGNGTTLIVAQTDATLLDRTLNASGLPILGLKEQTAFRPALQVLPLALQLLWRPADILGLVEFLTHPVCPIRSYARRKLAAKLAGEPGIGGTAWAEVLEDIASNYAEEAAKVLESIRYWIECERFDPTKGVPVSVIADRVTHLAAFFRPQLSDSKSAVALSARDAYAQCLDVLASLKQIDPSACLPAPQLTKLLAQATARGSGNPLLKTQVGACLAIDDPAAAIEATDEVVWWQLAMPSLPEAPPWSTAERAQLMDAGVALPSMADQLRWLESDWLKPVLAARRQLTLILPPTGAEIHPLWQMIEALLRHPKIRAIEDVLANPDLEPLSCQPLPLLRRWWQLPAKCIPRRNLESHSSISVLLNNPYQWVLRYPAALKLSRTLDVADGPRLYGLMVHRIVERFFKETEWRTLSESDQDAWFQRTFPVMIDEEGAVLRISGRRADLERCHFVAKRALLQLRRHFLDGGIVKVESELDLYGQYAGGEIGGSADLVVTKADGGRGVIDMKWSGEGRYAPKLANNTHLQLAIYAELLRQKHGAWPVVGYYILNVARLYAHDVEVFPGAVAMPGKEGDQTARLWRQFNQTWQWRDEQIRSGLIEVAMPGTEADEDSLAPEGALPMEKSQAKDNAVYNDYASLAGWGAWQ